MRDEELGHFILGTPWDFQKRGKKSVNCSGTEGGSGLLSLLFLLREVRA